MRAVRNQCGEYGRWKVGKTGDALGGGTKRAREATPGIHLP